MKPYPTSFKECHAIATQRCGNKPLKRFSVVFTEKSWRVIAKVMPPEIIDVCVEHRIGDVQVFEEDGYEPEPSRVMHFWIAPSNEDYLCIIAET